MTPRQEELQKYASELNELNKKYNVTLQPVMNINIVDLTPKEVKTDEVGATLDSQPAEQPKTEEVKAE